MTTVTAPSARLSRADRLVLRLAVALEAAVARRIERRLRSEHAVPPDRPAMRRAAGEDCARRAHRLGIPR